MNISLQMSGPVVVAALSGGLDSDSAASVQDRLGELIGQHDRILVDFTDVHCVSSAGLRTLVLLYRMAQGVGHSVGLVGLSPDLHNIMWATGFLEFFTVSESVEEAVASLAAEPGLEVPRDRVTSGA
jgi:anti-sigma B factor antagonist